MKKVTKKSRKFETLRILLSDSPTLAAQNTHLLRARKSSTQIFIPPHRLYINLVCAFSIKILA